MPVVSRALLRPLAAGLLVAAVAGCGGAREPAPATECMAWKGVRYCFPGDNLAGISSAPDKVTAHLRVPIGPAELRRCNAVRTRLDAVAYPYDNVDVLLTSIGPWVTTETLVADALRWQPAGVTATECPTGDATGAGKICIDRDPARGRVHVMACTRPDGVAIASCSDRTVAGGFEVDLNYSMACFSDRRAMRYVVQRYLETFRRRANR